MSVSEKRLDLQTITSLASDALIAQGFSEEQASAVARTVTAAERDACRSHGLFRIPFYIAALKNPIIDARAKPVVQRDKSAIVHVDAGGGFCPLALEVGLPALVETTRAHGIAALAIHRACNIAALWPEVEALADQGLVAFAFTASNAYVAPAGGREPLYGTNPMAFGWPRPGGSSLVFDQASSASARGEIQLHQEAGTSLPEGWAIDSGGQATCDPDAALAGAQLPFGGHKGASIALMIELLAGALIGDLFSHESSAQDVEATGAPFGGEFLIAIEPAGLSPGAEPGSQFDRAEALFERVLAQEGTRLPSARRRAARIESERDGVRVSRELLTRIDALTQAAGGA